MSESDQLSGELERLKSVVTQKMQQFASDRTIRRYVSRLEKLELGKVTAEQAIRVLAIFLSTPLGQWLAVVVALELLAKAKFFSAISVDVLIGVITASELVSALAKAGIVPEIAGLAGLFG
jgi:deoxyribodipyrimidine photolyase-like uncharacterized protein